VLVTAVEGGDRRQKTQSSEPELLGTTTRKQKQWCKTLKQKCQLNHGVSMFGVI